MNKFLYHHIVLFPQILLPLSTKTPNWHYESDFLFFHAPYPGLLNQLHWVQFSSVQLSHSVMIDSLRPHGLQHTRPPCPSPTPGVYSYPLSQWCHPTISSSVIHFSSCLQSFPAPGSFQMSQFSASGGQSIGVSASASVLPVSIQDWLISFRMDWLDLLAAQGTLRSPL